MFKIESYITPLLMGYVDKYVKLRPEDFQLSLWGGDAVLNNLDLRLDVIEQTINLPITFKSGHIHELHIHVPWTRLGSEPVVITINTIECILRLKESAGLDDEEKSSKSGSSLLKAGSQQLRVKAKRQEEEELPPGYIQSLVNKIINNVSIIVNNLILKFVEDDIVLSVNIKSAESYSVDPNWNRAFIELSPPLLILRKVINFCDLTVCLDKCDSSGRIDAYQDPLLYRCSLSCRLHMTYEGVHSKLPSITKFNVFCEKLDLSLTDTQLPLFLRLIELCIALYYGTLELPVEDREAATEPGSQEVLRQSAECQDENQQKQDGSDDQSWGSWAWSFVPQILPPEEESEDQEENRPRRKPAPASLCIGFYVAKTSVMLKLTTIVREPLHYGPNRISFEPFIFIEAEGLSSDILLFGYRFFDVQCGVTALTVSSVGRCVCRARDADDPRTKTLLHGGEAVGGKLLNFLTNSLFDVASPENCQQSPSFVVDPEKHTEVYTEQFGLQKYGFFWFDYLYIIQVPERKQGSRSSASSGDATESLSVKENSSQRFVVGSCTVNISSSLVHRLEKLVHCAADHEYEPYSRPKPEIVDEGRPHPTDEEVRSLEEFVSTRTYHLTLLQQTIYLLAAEHAHCNIKKRCHSRDPECRQTLKQTSGVNSAQYLLPAVQFSTSRFDLQITMAMYPRKLVQLVSTIAGPSSQLMHHCYSHVQSKVFGFCVKLVKVSPTGGHSNAVTVVPAVSGALYKRSLLFPVYWKNPYLANSEFMFELPCLSVNLRKAHVLFLLHIWGSWLEKKPQPTTVLDSSLIDDVIPDKDEGGQSKFPMIEFSLSGLEMRICSTPSAEAITGTLSALQAVVYISRDGKDSVVPVFCGPLNTEEVMSSSFFLDTSAAATEKKGVDNLVFTVQLPTKTDIPEAPALVHVDMAGIAALLDPALFSWLDYSPKLKHPLKPDHQQTVTVDPTLAHAASPIQMDLSQVSLASSSSARQAGTSQTPGQSQTATRTQSASQLPSANPGGKAKKEGSEITDSGDKWGQLFAKAFPLLRLLQLQIEIQSWSIFVPLRSTVLPDPSLSIPVNVRQAFSTGCLSDTVVFCLPHVTLHSTGVGTASVLQDIPIRSLEGSLMGDKLPWSVTLSNFSGYSLHPQKKVCTLVKPVSVSCTVAVSTKYNPPASDTISSLSLCLHTDMHTVNFACSFDQVQLCFSLFNYLIAEGSGLLKLLLQIPPCKDERASDQQQQHQAASLRQPVCQPSAMQTYSTSISNDVGLTETSGEMSREATPIRDLNIDGTKPHGIKLSLWLQWTCPKCQLKLYGQEKAGEETKITCVLEDLAASVDVQEVYIKAKSNIGLLNISHAQRKPPDVGWRSGPYKGILLSCIGELARNTQIVTTKLWSSNGRQTPSASLNFFPGADVISREKRHGFLSVTFTRALCKNVKKKLRKLNVELVGLHDSEPSVSLDSWYFNEYVSEICVNMEPCDTVLYFPSIMSVFHSLDVGQLTEKRDMQRAAPCPAAKAEKQRLPCTSTLPLMFFNLSSLRLFLPTGDEQVEHPQPEATSDTSEQMKTTLDHDLFLLQLHSLVLTPSADNPLPRYAVRKDLYAQALQAGITQQMGSAIEDRQYQFDIKGLTLCTGCWCDFIRQRTKSGSEASACAIQIPALEWNTFLSPLQHGHGDVKLIPLASSFNLKIVLAPPIVYDRPGTGGEVLMVCSAAAEVNVTSDMDFYVSVQQIKLFHMLCGNNFAPLLENGSGPSASASKDFDRYGGVGYEHHVTDSGLGSDASAVTCQGTSGNRMQKPSWTGCSYFQSGQGSPVATPFDVLLTGGRISCMLYSHAQRCGESGAEEGPYDSCRRRRAEGDLEVRPEARHPEAHHSYWVDSPSRDDEIICEKFSFMNVSYEQDRTVVPDGRTYGLQQIVPYFYLYISQPHTVVCWQPNKQKFEMSFYDVMVKGPSRGYTASLEDWKLLPDSADFSEYWLETRAGQPHPKTGVPPCFFTLRVMDFIQKPACVALHLERPLKLNLSIDKMLQVEACIAELQLSRAEGASDATTPAVHKSPEQKQVTTPPAVMQILTWTEQVKVTSDQVLVSLEARADSPKVVMSLSSVMVDTEFRQNGKGTVDEIISSVRLKDFFVRTSYLQKMCPFVGPCTLNLSATLQWCAYSTPSTFPKSVITLDTGLIMIHFGQEHVMCLHQLFDEVQRHLKGSKDETKVEDESRQKVREEPVKETKESFINFQMLDDLRMGGFQYVMEQDDAKVHPNSKEIVFCNGDDCGNASSMTWCYEQPRVISRVTVAPVPFSLPDEKNLRETTTPAQIACTLQYWDVLSRQFINYTSFNLSENDSSNLLLPEVSPANSPELVVAQIWRVVIHQKATHCSNSDHSVLPASLAASMMVDSCFVPSLLPLFQVLFTSTFIQVKFSNDHRHLGKEIPSKLLPFYFDRNSCHDLEFAVLTLEVPAVMVSYWSSHPARTAIQFSTSCQLDVVEFGNLTQQTLIEPFDVRGEMSTSLKGEECVVVSCNCAIEMLTVKIGKGMMHTLYCVVESWKQLEMYSASLKNSPLIIFSHYIICNDTDCTIRFGQVGTDENIILQSRQMHCYGWRSHRSTQLLHLCLDKDIWRWCDAFSINSIGTIVRSVRSLEQNYTLIVKVKQLSNIQKQIIISGQLVVSSCLNQPVEIKVVTQQPCEELAMVVGVQDKAPSLVLHQGEVRFIKVRMMGLKTMWSQEVYVSGDRMKEDRLVKIPVTDKNNLIHIWCRMFCQHHKGASQNMVVLSPLFVIRAHLPHPLLVDIDTPKLKSHHQVEVPAKGQMYQLQCIGGDIVHSLTFQLSNTMRKSSPPVSISTGMIEQMDRSPADKMDVDTMAKEWRINTSLSWPYIDQENENDSQPLAASPIKASFSSVSNLESPQPSIDLNVVLSECWPGISTILLDITPWCLFTNHSGIDLIVIGPDDQHWNVLNGRTFTPPLFQEYFQLGLKMDDHVLTSGSISLSKEEVGAQRYRTDMEVLYTDGFVNTEIFCLQGSCKKVFFLTVASAIRHDIRIITVRERFSITNLSRASYQLQTFCISLGQEKASLPKGGNVQTLPMHSKTGGAGQVHPLLCWTIQPRGVMDDEAFNQRTNFIHYLMLKDIDELADEEWSLPTRLVATPSGIRMTAAVSMKSKNHCTTIPIVVSGHIKDGQTYFVMEEDTLPFCLLYNCCSFPLLYGQSLMNLSVSGVTVLEETELVDCLPTILPGRSVHYTLPFLNEKFPDASGSQILPKIHMSSKLDKSSSQTDKVVWSSGVDLLSYHDMFLKIPDTADVKVHVERIAMTTHLVVEPVSKAEISAKEIRSRIKGKETMIIMKEQDHKETVRRQQNPMKTHSWPLQNFPDTGRQKTKLCFNCGCYLKSFCIVLLDESSSADSVGEVLRVSLDSVYIVHYPAFSSASASVFGRTPKSCTAVCVGTAQIDNQLVSKGQYDFPVLLVKQNSEEASGLPAIKETMSQIEKHAILKSTSFLHVQVVLESGVGSETSVVRAMEISVKPLSMFVEDAFMYRLLKETQAFIPISLSSPHLLVSLKTIPNSVLLTAHTINSPIRIQYLCVHPINMLLSIHASLKLFIASDHTPLSFGKFERDKTFTSVHHLIRTMTMHYASGALFRAGIVVGSLEILGNPTGLIRNIGTGVADLLKLPFTGLTRGPGAFLAGVSQGMSSLLQNITTGTLTSITNFASSVSRNMDRLSLDLGHLERQEVNRRNRPEGLSDGLRQGLTGLGLGLLGAIAGIADQPIQGILSSQVGTQSQLIPTSAATGFVTGMGKGLVGVFTKPIGGAAELVSQTGQGILHGVGLTKLPKAKYQLCVEPISQLRNGSVKHTCKILQSVPSSDLIMSVDAIQFDLAGFGMRVVLLLTPEILFVFDCDDDMQTQIFSLTELEQCLTSSDPALLSFVWRDTLEQHTKEDADRNKDRVAAFLDSSSGFVALPDQESSACDSRSDSSSPVNRTSMPCYEFHVNPYFKDTFLTLFEMARNQLLGRGFPV